MAEIKCIQCRTPFQVANPDGTDIVELLPIDKESGLKEDGKDYRIAICSYCTASTIAVLTEKLPVKKKSD